jgi:Trypsin-like peptidase domain
MSSLHRHLRFGGVFIASMLGIIILTNLASAQESQPYKAGVVRIQNTKFSEVGAGFVLKVDKDRAYIITAAHVVRGDGHPNVYFFNRPNDPFQAVLVNREDDDQKGLALLEVKANKEVMKGLAPLKLGDYFVKGGESVEVIGFPDGTTIWSVTRANVSRLEGRNLVFTGPIRGGNSGGPVLFNGQVIGLVTDTIQDLDYALRAENIAIYIKGIDPQLANSLTKPVTESAVSVVPAENSRFCAALSQIISASRNDFSAIVNVKSSSSSSDILESTITLPGTSRGSIYAESKTFVTYSNSRDKYGSDYYKFVSMMKQCLPEWRQTDSSKDRADSPDDFKVIDKSESKYYRFTESNAGVAVEVSQRKYDSDKSYYMTEVTIYAPDSPVGSGRFLSGGGDAQSALDVIGDEDRADEVCQAILKVVEAGHGDFYAIVKPSGFGGFFNSTLEIPGFPVGIVRPRDRVSFRIHSDKTGEIEAVYYRVIAILKRCLTDWRQQETQSPTGNVSYQFFEGNDGPVVEISHSNRKGTDLAGRQRTDLGGVYNDLTLTVYSPNSFARPR